MLGNPPAQPTSHASACARGLDTSAVTFFVLALPLAPSRVGTNAMRWYNVLLCLALLVPILYVLVLIPNAWYLALTLRCSLSSGLVASSEVMSSVSA